MAAACLARRGIALLLLAAAPALAAPQRFELPTAAPETPVVASGISDYASAAAAIVGVLTQSLQLPMPRYAMEVYADPAEFEQGLVRHLALSPETARSAAGFAKAAVGSRRILVNDTLLARVPWPERIVTLAHEMVHACQLQLAGHRSLTRQQWLVEGFAEWIAFRVADALGTRSLAAERTATMVRVRAARAGKGLAPLARMDTLAQWVETRAERGFDATYGLAWLATEFLVERHGYDRVLSFFRLHRDGPDAQAHFRAAFGEDLQQFEAALHAHLDRVLQ
ncbi:MAG: hypothetical protein ACO1PB_03420 [Ramlibacter sp.]